MKNVLFVKYSNERKKQFQIVTTIIEKDKKKYVRKRALTEEGKVHINNMYLNSVLLAEEINEKNKIVINKCTKIDSSEIEFEYIEGKNLEEIWNECINIRDIERLYKEISKFIKWFKNSYKSKNFEKGQKFVEVFGEIELPLNVKAFTISNIDLIPSNIIINDRINIIDYEWTFSFPVPINYILFRAVFFHRKLNLLEDKIKEKIYYELIGLTKEEITLYKTMEENFQKYVADSKNSLLKLYDDMPIKNYHLEQINLKEMYIEYKLYFIKNKQQQIILNSAINNYSILIECDVSKYKDIKEFILQPADSSCILKLEYMKGITKDGREQEIICSNSNEIIKIYNEYYFAVSNPLIKIKNNQYEKIKIRYIVSVKNSQQVEHIIRLTIQLNSLKHLLKRSFDVIIKKLRKKRK